MSRGAVFFLVCAAWSLAAGSCTCGKRETSAVDAVGSHPPLKAAAPEPAVTLRSVWGSGPSDVWAVGAQGTILRFDGHTWQPIASGTTENLTGVGGTAANDVWVVGETGVTLHFDGKAFTLSDQPAGLTLLSVWPSSRSEVWVAGIDNGIGVLRHYQEGKAWESLRMSGSTGLWRAWASGPTDIWLVGSDSDAKGFVVRGDGKRFDHKVFDGGPLRGVWGASDQDVWVAAYDGTLHHWDGSAWTKHTTDSKAHWLGLTAVGDHDFWAYGLAGVVYHYDNTNQRWSSVDSGSHEVLWSAWGSSPQDLWIVGNKGTRLHWTGQGFQ